VLLLQNTYFFWLTNHFILSVRDDGYSRNASCALYLTSTFYYNDVLILLYNMYGICLRMHVIPNRHTGGRCYCDRIVVGFTTTCVISAYHTKCMSSNPVNCEVYSIHHCVIKFVSDFQHFGGFRRVLRFPPPIKLIATI
jgi:hypothetical protein